MAGEEEGRREAVLVAELGGGEPGLLTGFWQVCLGGHEDAGDLAVHVVFLRERAEGPARGEQPAAALRVSGEGITRGPSREGLEGTGRKGLASNTAAWRQGLQHQGCGRPAPAAPSWETRGCRSKAESPRAPATYLINTGTVAEGSGVAQVIDQAGDVAGSVRWLRELCVSADLVQLEQEGKGHVARRCHTETGLAPTSTQPRGTAMVLQLRSNTGGTAQPCCEPLLLGRPKSAAPAP